MGSGVQLVLVDGEDKSSVNANADKIVSQWFARFEATLAEAPLNLNDLFHEDSWLKDALALSWDLRTLQGISKITHYVQEHKALNGLFNMRTSKSSYLRPSLKEMGPAVWLESAFEFETNVGQGRGVLRLANTAVGEWRAWVVFLRLEELKGHPPKRGLNRPRFRQQLLPAPRDGDDTTEPAVVVIGGGISNQYIA
jgi:hypothetical protein